MSLSRSRRVVGAVTICTGAIALAALFGPATASATVDHGTSLPGTETTSSPFGGDPVPGLRVDCFGLAYIPQLVIQAQPLNTTYGTPGDDVIFGTSGNDVIIALEGDDRVCAGDGDDEVYGDEWFAWYDTDGDPGGGDDLLDGGEDHDLLFGGEGADELHGRRHNDILNGGDGDDVHYGELGEDGITCGDGDDDAFTGLNADSVTSDCEFVS